MDLKESFSFSNPTKIVFGVGEIANLTRYITADRICLITTEGFTRRGMTAKLKDMFGTRLCSIIDNIQPNPDLEALDAIIDDVRKQKPNAILALGGGSAIDSGKIIAKCITTHSEWSLAKHFRDGISLPYNIPLPCYVVPTTSGTGAEVTPFATVWDGTTKTKYSLASADMFPTTAIVDPEVTVDMPREVTLSTGLDAISQALESVWNKSCNHITLGWATTSLNLSLNALIKAAEEPANISARTDMAQASLLAGLCISHTRTALAHSISYPLTAHFGLPHGFACSFTLPALIDFNREVDDGRLNFVAAGIGLGDAHGLRDKISSVLENADIKRYIAHYIGQSDNLLIYVKEMLTPNRSGNNVRPVDYNDVTRIITNSIK